MNSIMRYVVFVAISLLAFEVSAKEQTMLVLDASGSMWGQIDKKPKIEIARGALKKLIAEWPEERETGLIVYGHRLKGSCTDIQTILPVGPLDATELAKIIDGIKPKGKTPLSAAVKQAAEEMNYTEDKATVILISDGKETCDIDPCALGVELEKIGVDFTAHVIGFDVVSEEQEGLRCLAENTGGDFIAASDAKELSEALSKAVKVVEPEPEVAEAEQGALPEISLKAPETVINGADFNVELNAPKGTDGRVYLYAKGKDRALTYQRIQTGKIDGFKPVLLRAPVKTGDYVLKFLTLSKRVVTEREIQVVEAEVKLESVDEVPKSSKVLVTLIAPSGIQGRVYLYAHGKKKPVDYQRIQSGITENYEPVFIRVPAKTGVYDLKFLTLRNEVLAEKSITVIDAEIAIEAPESAPRSTDIKVIVHAPEGIDGRLFINKKGKNKSISYQRLQKGRLEGYMPVKLRMPAAIGDYELKLRSLKNEILAEANIKVEDAEINIIAPDTVPRGTRINVTIDATEGMTGRIHLFTKDKTKAYDEQRLHTDTIEKYRPLVLRAPAKAGEYILRFMTLRRELLAEKKIVVTDAEISLNAPTEAIKGSLIDATPVGPPGLDGRIFLYKVGKRKPVTQQRISEGAIEDYDPNIFKLPDVAGEYKLKFQSLRKELFIEHFFKVTEAE